MMSVEKEGKAPVMRIVQCSSVGKYQDRVVGGGGLANRGMKRTYGTFRDRTSRKGNII